MRVEQLTQNKIPDFINYCRKYKLEHDASYLFDDELNNFSLNSKNNPTFILLDESNQIIGTASLIQDINFRQKRKGRFRIFHCTKPDFEAYKTMLDSILSCLNCSIDNIYLFIPESKAAVHEILFALGFKIQRYSWTMTKSTNNITEPLFGENYILKPLQKNKDESIWCDIYNNCFSNTSGHTDITVDMVLELENSSCSIENGMLILWKNDTPIGLLNIEKDEDDPQNALIGPIAVLPEYRGKSFGKNLLRAGIKYSKESGFHNTILSVSAENDTAANLYIKEGFVKISNSICFNKCISK